MIVHAFMIELDQPDYWYPRKKKYTFKVYMYKVNGELFSYKSMVWQIQWPEFRVEKATIHNFA